MFCKINGAWVYLWCEVDKEGATVDILLQRKRDKKAAKRFLKKVRKQSGCPHTVVTDKLKSYREPCKEVFSETLHIHDKRANNRAENSHQETHLLERKMRRFKSIKQAQIFLSCFARIYDHFRGDQHLCSAKTFRIQMNRRFEEWQLITQVTSKI